MVNWNKGNRKQSEEIYKPSTESIIKPGDYPLGSLESRAAARSLAKERTEKELVIQIVYVSPDGTEKNGPVYRAPWH